MIDEITEKKRLESLRKAFLNKTPIFIDADYKLKNSIKYTDNQKHCMYLELLHNSICTEDALSMLTDIRLNDIRRLNNSHDYNLLSFEYFVCNNNGCNVYSFETLNTKLYNEYKDVDTTDY